MKLTTVVKVVNGFVLVDTCFTFDCGYETMAFPCTAEGEVLDWGDVYCRRYADAISAAFGHEIACAELVSLVLG